MSPWLFSVYMDGRMKVVKIGMGRKGVKFLEDGRESGDCLASLFYVVNRRRT